MEDIMYTEGFTVLEDGVKFYDPESLLRPCEVLRLKRNADRRDYCVMVLEGAGMPFIIRFSQVPAEVWEALGKRGTPRDIAAVASLERRVYQESHDLLVAVDGVGYQVTVDWVDGECSISEIVPTSVDSRDADIEALQALSSIQLEELIAKTSAVAK